MTLAITAGSLLSAGTLIYQYVIPCLISTWELFQYEIVSYQSRNFLIKIKWSVLWLIWKSLYVKRQSWYWSRPQCGWEWKRPSQSTPPPPGQNGRHFTDDIFRCIFVNEKCCVLIKILLKFVPKGPVESISALVWIMAWRRIGDKPLSEPILTRFTDAYMRH